MALKLKMDLLSRVAKKNANKRFKQAFAFLLLLFFCSITAYAQSWEPLGNTNEFGQASYDAVSYNSTITDESGNLYVAYSDGANSSKLTVKKWDGSTWSVVGSVGVSAGTVSYISAVVSGGNLFVAYQDGGNSSKLTVQKWDGSAWSVVGSVGVSAGTVSYISAVVCGGNLFVAYRDGASTSKLTVQKWDGSAWSVVGSAGISVGGVQDISAVVSGSDLFVAYRDAANSSKLTVQKWDGSAWSVVGSAGVTAGGAQYNSAVVSGGNLFVAYSDGGNSGKLTVQKWDGSSWSIVGSAGISAGSAYSISAVVSGGNLYVAYQDGGNGNKLTVQKWDGSAWSVVGSVGVSAGTVSYISAVVSGGNLFVAYSDGGNSNKLTVQKWDGSSWSVVGSAGISAATATYISAVVSGSDLFVAYRDGANGNKLTVQKWDGSAWSVVGSAGISAAMATYISAVVSGGNLFVAYSDVANGYKLTIQKWDGSAWSVVGSAGISASSAYSISAVVSGGNLYVAYQDGGNSNKLTVQKWDGSAWSVVGSAGVSAGMASNISAVVSGGNLFVAYGDGYISNKLTVQKWDGSAWSGVGSAGVTAGAAQYNSAVVSGGNLFVAYRDAANSSKLTVKKWDGSAWSVVGSAGISAGMASNISAVVSGSNLFVAYQDGGNSSKLTVQKWDGSAWSVVGSAGVSAGIASYESMTIDGSGNLYVAYSSVQLFAQVYRNNVASSSIFQTTGNWSTASNWSAGLPGATTDVTIAANCNIDGNYTVKDVTVNAGQQVTIASGSTLTTSGNLILKSDASGTASLIGTTTVGGTTMAERYMTGNAWHLVSPIAASGSISTFIQAPGNSIPSKDVGGTNRYAMMDYDETTNKWNTYYAATTTDILPAGKGYSMRRASDGIVTFTGDLTSGTKLVWLGMSGMGWNCIGNPYTSAINMNNAANASYNFLKTNAIDNTSTLDPSYACMYVWDDATLSYKILGNVSYGTRDLLQNVLQSGQGFFVKAASEGVIVQFTQDMQVHSTSTNLKSAEAAWPGFELTASASGVKASTVVAFNSAMTKGLDPTYDAGLLRGSNGLSLYTKLIDDNGVDFAIQCLPEKGMDSFVIPVGLDAKAGGEVKFSATATSLPDGCNIILEDRLNKTLTLLESGKELAVTVAANTSGTGRFYIHTSNLTTGISGLLPEEGFSLKAYPADGIIRIEGQVSCLAKAYLFSTSGSNLGMFNLQEGTRNNIPASGLATGVYLLKITDGSKQFNTKVVIYE